MAQTSLPFDRNADRWRCYTESLKGRMRRALIVAQLEAHLAQARLPLRVLDAGCGNGGVAAALSGKSNQMTLLDFSAAMLEQAGRRVSAAAGSGRCAPVVLIHGRIEQIDAYLGDQVFDLILCHNLLDYVEAPRTVLTALAARLSPLGYLSLVAANRYGQVFKNALSKCDLEAALLSLENQNATADLFDKVSKRTFAMAELEALVRDIGLTTIGGYGIRVFTDYLPARMAATTEIEPLLLRLEKAAGAVQACLQVARDLHLICRKPSD